MREGLSSKWSWGVCKQPPILFTHPRGAPRLAGRHPFSSCVLPWAGQTKSLSAPWLRWAFLQAHPQGNMRAACSLNPRPSRPHSWGQVPSIPDRFIQGLGHSWGQVPSIPDRFIQGLGRNQEEVRGLLGLPPTDPSSPPAETQPRLSSMSIKGGSHTSGILSEAHASYITPQCSGFCV